MLNVPVYTTNRRNQTAFAKTKKKQYYYLQLDQKTLGQHFTLDPT